MDGQFACPAECLAAAEHLSKYLPAMCKPLAIFPIVSEETPTQAVFCGRISTEGHTEPIIHETYMTTLGHTVCCFLLFYRMKWQCAAPTSSVKAPTSSSWLPPPLPSEAKVDGLALIPSSFARFFQVYLPLVLQAPSYPPLSV